MSYRAHREKTMTKTTLSVAIADSNNKVRDKNCGNWEVWVYAVSHYCPLRC